MSKCQFPSVGSVAFQRDPAAVHAAEVAVGVVGASVMAAAAAAASAAAAIVPAVAAQAALQEAAVVVVAVAAVRHPPELVGEPQVAGRPEEQWTQQLLSLGGAVVSWPVAQGWTGQV